MRFTKEKKKKRAKFGKANRKGRYFICTNLKQETRKQNKTKQNKTKQNKTTRERESTTKIGT